jgi:hypothetical protein
MDETGMSEADKIEFVDDVLLTCAKRQPRSWPSGMGSICRRSSTNTGTRTRRHDTKLASLHPRHPRSGAWRP